MSASSPAELEGVLLEKEHPETTPDVVKPPPGNPSFPLVNSLRALAALSVLMLHTTLLSGVTTGSWVGAYTSRLDIGVTIFFLISGFLLYRPYVLARFHDAKPIRARDFARRRILRIVPAYWVALTVLGIYPGLKGLWEHDWWIFYLFLQIYGYDHFDGGIFAAWTLCIEVTFYIALPFIAFAMQRLLSKRNVRTQVRNELLILLGIAILSTGFRVLVREGGFEFGWWLNTLPAFLDWFALGMGIAVISAAAQHSQPLPRSITWLAARPLLCWATAAALFWVISTRLGLPKDFTPVDSSLIWNSAHVLYGICAFFVVLPGMVNDTAGGLPRKVLAWRWLAWVGLISYGVYLYHLPILGKLAESGAGNWIPGGPFISMLTLVLLLSGTCATLSYYLVERPILRFKDRRKVAAAS